MFVGTILHSLDHTLMDWNLKDPLRLDVDDPRFGKMAQSRLCFGCSRPLLPQKVQGKCHKVYRKAAKINKKLADNMATFIIK
mmetsp:Transcript_15155/g.24882  ORF Transcript_15155/g.24882 Transcript_15155/m.24882 type:complete len:82 (-) Transcript_15155:30-275(-)